jgi:hypothetical protein
MTARSSLFFFTAATLAAAFTAASAAERPFHDKPESPRSLPADNLPPFRMLDEKGNLIPIPPLPPRGLHRRAGSPPESSARGPSLALAIEAARTAVEFCGAAGFHIGGRQPRIRRNAQSVDRARLRNAERQSKRIASGR